MLSIELPAFPFTLDAAAQLQNAQAEHFQTTIESCVMSMKRS